MATQSPRVAVLAQDLPEIGQVQGPGRPACHAKYSLLATVRIDKLHAQWQAVRSVRYRQGETGRTKCCPGPVEDGIAGGFETYRRLAGGARSQDHLARFEQVRETFPALLDRVIRFRALGCRRLEPAPNERLETIAEFLAVVPPFGSSVREAPDYTNRSDG